MEKLLPQKSQTQITLSFFSLLFFFIGCEQEVVVEEVVEEEQIAISDLIQQKSYWEGSNNEFEETFILNDEGNIKKWYSER